ncbi:hypothetical protein L1887_49528 [Cichorium endivia]|nr:hypothetical protein L1887_49528 [Cichorium endivia]
MVVVVGCTCTGLRFVFTSCCSFLNPRAFNDWPVAVAGLSRVLRVKKWHTAARSGNVRCVVRTLGCIALRFAFET